METAKACLRASAEHLRLIKKQFSFERTRLRFIMKNRRKVNVLAAPPNV